MATELSDLIIALLDIAEKYDDDDIKRAILLLDSVLQHHIEPTERDNRILRDAVAKIESEESSDS